MIFLQHADAEQLLPVLQQLLGQAVTPPTTRQRLRQSRTANDGEMVDVTPPPAPARP